MAMTPAERMRKWRAENPEKAKAAYKRSRERRKDKEAAYREAHREEMAAYQHKYRLAHREEIAEREKRWRREHPEKRREYVARYRAAHPERAREYRQAHKEEMSEYKRLWQMANPDKIAAEHRKWRLEGPAGTVYREWRQQGCRACGATDWRILVGHHIDPAQKDGTFLMMTTAETMTAELAKCIALCANHHILVHHEMRGECSGWPIEDIISKLRSDPETSRASGQVCTEERDDETRNRVRSDRERRAGYMRQWRLNGPGGSFYREWREQGCRVCGESDWRVVQAHHIDPAEKETGFNKIYALEKMKAELAKCVQLCANHHLLIHFAMHTDCAGWPVQDVIEKLKQEKTA